MTFKREVLIATKNKGKAKEFEILFDKIGFEVKTLLDYPEIEDVEETGDTFHDNARLKAETISKLLNKVVLADDSGLVVDALHGQPGVYSARYAGEEKNDASNNAKLLNELSDVSSVERKAHFHCTLALAQPGKETLLIDGTVEGEIAEVPRGDNGFGYDPLFYLPHLNQTMAELSDEEKNRISHRANALEKLAEQVSQWIN